MKKFKKIISIISICIIILASLPITIFAQGKNDKTNLTFLPQVESQIDAPEARSINGIPITVTAKKDGTGVDVYVGNVGVDGLDMVTVTISATGYSSTKSQKSYVPAVIGKNFSFDIPMIKCNTTYSATIRIVDGSGTDTKTGKATINYNENVLRSAKWHRGTFASRSDSLDSHFNKHAAEVNAKNIVSYLNQACNYRSEIISDISSNNTKKYNITTGTGKIPSKKYKNKNDLRFELLTDADKEILSFGR